MEDTPIFFLLSDIKDPYKSYVEKKTKFLEKFSKI